MTIDDKIIVEKLQYDIKGDAATMSALSISLENLKDMSILELEKDSRMQDESRMIEQAKFTYSLLGKVFEKQTKTFEDHG